MRVLFIKNLQYQFSEMGRRIGPIFTNSYHRDLGIKVVKSSPNGVKYTAHDFEQFDDLFSYWTILLIDLKWLKILL